MECKNKIVWYWFVYTQKIHKMFYHELVYYISASAYTSCLLLTLFTFLNCNSEIKNATDSNFKTNIEICTKNLGVL